MVQLIKLDQALEEIMENIVLLVDAENGKEKELGIKATVVRGDRARPMPTPPVVWVRGLPAIPDHSRRSQAEVWTLPVIILGIVKDDDPEKGYARATQLTARARSIVLGDRTLNRRTFVQDVRSGRFEMSGPNMQNDTIFGATAIIEVKFIILERNP